MKFKGRKNRNELLKHPVYIPRLEASRYISSAMNRPWGGYSCFSIYQISWIKIEKELFVKKRRDLVRVCLRFNLQCLGGSFFMILFFLSTSKHRPAKFCLFLGICWCSCFNHLPLNFIFRNCRETRSHFESVPKQWISKDIPSYGSQSERAKVAIHWFGQY